MLNTLKVSIIWTTIVVLIFELFFFFVYNPNEVILGSDIIKDGHIVTATQWDVTWSYIFPIEYGFWTVVVVTSFITLFDILWRTVINATVED